MSTENIYKFPSITYYVYRSFKQKVSIFKDFDTLSIHHNICKSDAKSNAKKKEMASPTFFITQFDTEIIVVVGRNNIRYISVSISG